LIAGLEIQSFPSLRICPSLNEKNGNACGWYLQYQPLYYKVLHPINTNIKKHSLYLHVKLPINMDIRIRLVEKLILLLIR